MNELFERFQHTNVHAHTHRFSHLPPLLLKLLPPTTASVTMEPTFTLSVRINSPIARRMRNLSLNWSTRYPIMIASMLTVERDSWTTIILKPAGAVLMTHLPPTPRGYDTSEP